METESNVYYHMQITQTDSERSYISVLIYIIVLLISLHKGDVDSVSEHDGDNHEAREARHEGEHAGVQLRVIRLIVVAIFCRVPEQKWRLKYTE